MSQILNDGNINFSLEKLIEIALKVDKIPAFLFEDKSSYLERERQLTEVKRICRPYDQKKRTTHMIADNPEWIWTYPILYRYIIHFWSVEWIWAHHFE